jgi:hypothetical protein
MKRVFLAIIAVLAMAVSASPVHAASETSHVSFQGQTANAFFSSTDPGGCVVTSVFVFANDGRTKTGPGGPLAESFALVAVSQFNQCTDTQLLSAEGSAALAADDFQMDSRLTAATLDSRIELFDFVSGTSFPVDISLTWTGSGDTSTEKSHNLINAPGLKINSFGSGLRRGGTATGTVTAGTTNFTPEPSIFVELLSVKSGEVRITHG